MTTAPISVPAADPTTTVPRRQTTGDPALDAVAAPPGFCEYGWAAGALIGGYSESIAYDDVLPAANRVLRAFQTLESQAPAALKPDASAVVEAFARAYSLMSQTSSTAELRSVMRTDPVAGIVRLPAFERLAAWFDVACGPPPT